MTNPNHLGHFTIAAVVGTTPIWVDTLQNVSWIASILAPILAVVVGALQVWVIIKKHKKRN